MCTVSYAQARMDKHINTNTHAHKVYTLARTACIFACHANVCTLLHTYEHTSGQETHPGKLEMNKNARGKTI